MLSIIVNSCYKFYDKTIPRLIESAKKANIPADDIYIVVGESESEIPFTFTGNYNIAFCRYVNIDYNAAIYITQTEDGRKALSKYTHMFYTHDTITFLPHFYERIKTYLSRCPVYIKLHQKWSKSSGLINIQWFIKNKSELFEHFINYDLSLALQYKSGILPNRASLIDKFPDLPLHINEDSNFCFINGETPIGEYFNVISNMYSAKIYNGEERYVNEFIEPGVLKYQKNHNIVEWKITL